MKRIIAGVVALFLAFFTLILSLVIAIPLAVLALIAGKKISTSIKHKSNPASSSTGSVLEGEYEDVSSQPRQHG
ncbi:hypothetical protein ACODM8_14950 [Vibrio ostreicida]|uniref:hypothetical protein n=1 Tax=Vibrio ostreicida TaxID=526588 RepID=UPI00097096B6|nr:hypothetical protein [Vibrio ostreicida]